jgi:hypothetical protein
LRRAAVLAAVLVAFVLAASASADPTGSKNAFRATATCDNGMTVPIVVNSANGQGAGSENNTTAEWSPAHVIGSNLVFHPTVFDLTFTFTPADGSPAESFPQVDSRNTGMTQTTCDLSGSQTNPFGTFSLTGSVSGWLS